MVSRVNPYIDKIITAPVNTFVIFYVPTCPFSRRALDLLRHKNLPYKGYDINTIGGMPKLLAALHAHADLVEFNKAHKTKPIIFVNGKFVGGCNELVKLVSNVQN